MTVPFFVAVIRDVRPLLVGASGLYGMPSLSFRFGKNDGNVVC